MNSTFGKISTGTLITNDMNVKNQKQTEIGLVPESWKRILISDLGEIITGTTPKTIERKYYKNGKYHFIAPGDIGLTTQIYNTEKVITEEGLKVSRVLPKYSTCFVCIGSTIGKVGISTQEQSTTNQQINAVVPSDRYDPFYVCYLLKYWSEYLSSFSSPSPVPIMSKGKFQQITIYASQDNAEQIKIAKILKTIDQAIELQDKLIATTTELKQAAMEQLFTKGLHGEKQKETEIGLVPESWKVVSLGNVSSMKNGVNFSRGERGSGTLTIDVLNMFSKTATVDCSKLYRINKKLAPDFILKDQDILFVRSSLKQEGVGWSALFRSINEPVTFCGFLIRCRLSNSEINPDFLVYYLRLPATRSYLVSLSGKVAITNISQSVLQNLPIPMPKLSEQKEIAEQLQILDQKISIHEGKRKTLQELFQSLLNQLMTGEIRVNDLEIDVSEIS